MALNAEQQAQFDIQKDIVDLNNNHAVAMESKRARLEAIRLAKEVLVENRRSLPVGEREVAATDITVFAGTLLSFVNS